MTRDQQLQFCKVCHHRKPSMQQGLLCGLTNKVANFAGHCENFDEDVKERARILSRDLASVGREDVGESLNYQSNKQWGLIAGLFGLVLMIASLAITSEFGLSVFLGFGTAVYGVRSYLKGQKQEAIYLEATKKEDDQQPGESHINSSF